MPLPSNFSEWEHLQAQVKRIHNKAVSQWFKNQPDDDITTAKRSLKHACRIKDGDTVPMTQLRLWLFEVTAGHAASLQAPVYGIPVQEFQRDRKFRPQVVLHFRQSRADLDPAETGLRQAEGEIRFTLMDETSETINRAKAEALARDIKREMATPLFTWAKGIYYSYYRDLERGYDLRILAKSQTEGERVIKQVLAIQGHPFDDDNLTFAEHSKAYPANPGTHRVYGSTTKKPIRRPRADVVFNHAQLHVYGRPKAINLVARGSRLKSVIEYV